MQPPNTHQQAEALTIALASRDPDTAFHSRRVQDFAVSLGRAMNLPPTKLDDLNLGALLHDIGKLQTPDAILRTAKPLTEDEWKVMRLHPVAGANILCALKWPQPVTRIVEEHHERWDAAGYPFGLAGEQISIGARIVAVVDSYDAMTRPRHYQPTLTREQAREEILRCAGTQFDPNVVYAFLKLTHYPAPEEALKAAAP